MTLSSFFRTTRLLAYPQGWSAQMTAAMKSRTVVFCGPKFSRYTEMADLITRTSSAATRGITPDNFLAVSRDSSFIPHPSVSLEGRTTRIPSSLLPKKFGEDGYSANDLCPAAITTIIQENKARFEKGKPLIPVIFILEYSAQDRPKQTMDFSEASVHYVTSAELMRTYEHLEEVPDEKYREAARQSFHFLRASETPDQQITFDEIEAPWEGEGAANWQRFMTAYKAEHAAEKSLWWHQTSWLSRFF